MSSVKRTGSLFMGGPLKRMLDPHHFEFTRRNRRQHLYHHRHNSPQRVYAIDTRLNYQDRRRQIANMLLKLQISIDGQEAIEFG